MRNKKSSLSGYKCNIDKGLSNHKLRCWEDCAQTYMWGGEWGYVLERFCYIKFLSLAYGVS